MPIKISRDMPILGIKRSIRPVTKDGKTDEEVINGSSINKNHNNTIEVQISRRLLFDTTTLEVTEQNLIAANSTLLQNNISNDIAVLTRKYILKTIPSSITTKIT